MRRPAASGVRAPLVSSASARVCAPAAFPASRTPACVQALSRLNAMAVVGTQHTLSFGLKVRARLPHVCVSVCTCDVPRLTSTARAQAWPYVRGSGVRCCTELAAHVVFAYVQGSTSGLRSTHVKFENVSRSRRSVDPSLNRTARHLHTRLQTALQFHDSRARSSARALRPPPPASFQS